MDNNNWRTDQGQMAAGPPPQSQVNGGGEVSAVTNVARPAAMDIGDWRIQLGADSRQRFVNKLMNTLMRHIPYSGQEGLQELKKIATRFEETIYTAATSQSDYVQKISMKILTIETMSQNPMTIPLQPEAANTVNTTLEQDSTVQTVNVNVGDLQEEVYQKIKSMKDTYFVELNDLLVKVATKLQKYDSLPQQPSHVSLEKLRYYHVMLERLVRFLRINKSEVQLSYKDKLPAIQKQIISILNTRRPRRSAQQEDLPQPPQMPSAQPEGFQFPPPRKSN